MDTDLYKTLLQPGEEVLYKEKNSKFFGYAFPIQSEEDVRDIIDQIKKKHYNARHWCFAFQTGTGNKTYYRVNDDGEPGNTAGSPIHGQILSFGVTNVLVIAVRYFGGVKLGVGGLIQAYRATAQMALEASEIIEKTIDVRFRILFEYPLLNKVMRVIKEKNIQIIEQKMELDCTLIIATRQKNETEIFEIFHQIFGVKIQNEEIID